MDLEDQSGLRVDRIGIVLQMGPVGGANFEELCAGTTHDLRHAECAADLDKLAARNNCSAALGQGVEDDEDRGGVIVDDGCVLGTGELPQQPAHDVIAIAAVATCEIEFQCDRVAHRRNRRLDRRLGKECAAQVRVQNRSCEIEHRFQLRRAFGLKACQCANGGLLCVNTIVAAGSRCCECGADCINDSPAAETIKSK